MKCKILLILALIAVLLLTTQPTKAAAGTLPVTNLSLVTYEQQLKEMPKTIEYADLYCYGSLLISGDWGGVQLSYLLNQANITSEVRSIQLAASDGYRVTIPIELALSDQTIIAYELDGSSLAELRLILPGLNGAAWINQIISVSMSTNIVSGPSAVSATTAGSSDPASRLDSIAVTKENPASTPPPETLQPTPTSTPTITVSPTNNPESTQSIPQQQTTGPDATSTLTTIIASLAAILAVAGIIAFKHKKP